MGRTKYKKLIEVKSFPNVFDREQDSIGKLVRKYFNNKSSLTLEVGCGEGDYTVHLASNYPDRNFIGIDIKASRLYVGAKKVLDAGMTNAAFISMRVESLADFFTDEKIEEIYIPFPDPHVRRKSAFRRLISPEFINIYKSILADNGRIHLKTDNEGLFEYGLNNIKKADAVIYKLNENARASGDLTEAEIINTRYERHYVNEGRTIRYVCFGFK